MLKASTKYNVTLPNHDSFLPFEKPIWVESFFLFNKKKTEDKLQSQKQLQIEEFNSAFDFIFKNTTKNEDGSSKLTILLSDWIAQHNFKLFTNDDSLSEQLALGLSGEWLTQRENQLKTYNFDTNAVKSWKKDLKDKYPDDYEILLKLTNQLTSKNGFKESVQNAAFKKCIQINGTKDDLVKPLHHEFDESDSDCLKITAQLKKYIQEEIVGILLIRLKQEYKELLYIGEMSEPCLLAATKTDIKLSQVLLQSLSNDKQMQELSKKMGTPINTLLEDMVEKINQYPLKVCSNFSLKKIKSTKNQESLIVEEKALFKPMPTKYQNGVDPVKQIAINSFFNSTTISEAAKIKVLVEGVLRTSPIPDAEKEQSASPPKSSSPPTIKK